ncbi:O-antigen ligase [Schaalia sp. Marseille-Q2122]|uniref:O-antigen ligase family protein n=1 Tax=Schaalia sp. Marseille-Q2122 TaxID=2736604 RepID=UPI0020CA2B62|nr:O-antigen ligase family protein [Schaalia sp. Marseille-Q2122]
MPSSLRSVAEVHVPARGLSTQRGTVRQSFHTLGEIVTLLTSSEWHRIWQSLSAKASSIANRTLPAMGVWVFYITFAGQGVRNVIGWKPFGILAALSCLIFAFQFAAAGRVLTLRRIPTTIAAFLLWSSLSVLWSFYPLETVMASALMSATSLAGVLVAIAFPPRQLLDILTRSLQWMIGLSLLLEVYVAVILQERLAPLYMRNWEHIPDSYYWIHGLLLEGGPIQGVFANRNPLAFGAALLLLCILFQQLQQRSSWQRTALWVGLSVGTLALTRSATVMVCLVACLIVVAVGLSLRSVPSAQRRHVLRGVGVVALAFMLLAVIYADAIFALLGRSSDLTGRGVIWERLLALWSERPILGWGWIMYWAPWIPMFRTLVIRPDGTPTMQAHNAYIEALFQTGIIGALLVILAVVWVLYGVGKAAVRAIAGDLTGLWAFTVAVALIVQSLTESRLLSEGNWVLFVALATWLSLYRTVPSPAWGAADRDIRGVEASGTKLRALERELSPSV